MPVVLYTGSISALYQLYISSTLALHLLYIGPISAPYRLRRCQAVLTSRWLRPLRASLRARG